MRERRRGVRVHQRVLAAAEGGPERAVQRRAGRVQLGEARRLGVDDVEGGHRRGRGVGGQRRGEDVARAREALVRDDPCWARAEAADGGERVLHGADEHIDLPRLPPIVLGHAAAGGPERAKGEALVDDQIAAVRVAQPEQLGQRAEAAAVGVEPLDEEEAARALGGGQRPLAGLVALQHRLERRHVVVREGVRRAARELDADRGGEVDTLVEEQ